MKYIIKKRSARKINSFYHNVAKKNKHTYSEEMMQKNIDDAVDSIYQIERTLTRRQPSLTRWSNYHMANTDKWYFAYTIDDDTIPSLMLATPKTCMKKNLNHNL